MSEDDIELSAADFFGNLTFSKLPNGLTPNAAFVLIRGVDANNSESWWTRFSGDVNFSEVNWKLKTFLDSEVASEVDAWNGDDASFG